jgi:hypothetical protein
VRRQHDARVVPERVIGGQRLLAKDVEHCGRDLPRGERGEQILFDEMSAASGVDECRALWQQCQGGCVQYALGLGTQRQQADKDLAAAEEQRQAGRPGRRSFRCGSIRRRRTPTPSASSRHPARVRLAKDPHPHLDGVLLIELAPYPGLLLGAVVEVAAMQA